MRGDRADDTSALRLGGIPLRGGFFGQSSFATHVLAGPSNTVALAEPLDPALAAPLACSVQTGVGTVLNAASAGADDAVVVFGAGGVGLSAVMGARIAGCRAIVAVDPNPERRSLATELGATAVLDPTDGDVAAQLADLTGGGPTVAVDTTALPAVIATALAALRSCGTLALVGLGALTAELPVGLIMAKGLRVRGVDRGRQRPARVHPVPRRADPARRAAAGEAGHPVRVRRLRRRVGGRGVGHGDQTGAHHAALTWRSLQFSRRRQRCRGGSERT